MGREKFLAGLAQMDSTGLWSDNKKRGGRTDPQGGRGRRFPGDPAGDS